MLSRWLEPEVCRLVLLRDNALILFFHAALNGLSIHETSRWAKRQRGKPCTCVPLRRVHGEAGTASMRREEHVVSVEVLVRGLACGSCESRA